MNFDKIRPEDIIFHEDRPEPFKYSLSHKASSKYDHLQININFIYHDILNNEYIQKINMKVSMHTSISNNGTSAKYGCDLHLLDVTKPLKR